MANRYWVGGTGTWDASDTTHWAAVTGGAGGQSVPGSSDDVTLDASSGGGTVTVNTNFSVISLTMGDFTGTLDFSVNNNSPAFSGLINISGTGTRTLKMGSGTWTSTRDNTIWNSSTITNLTFDAGTSTIKVTSALTATRIFTGGGLTFYNFWNATSGANALRLSGGNTFNNIKIDPGRTQQFADGTTTTISSLTATGSLGNEITFTGSSTGGWTISKSSGVISCDYLILDHSAATGGATFYAGANSTNGGSNTGWIFTAPPQTATGNMFMVI